MNKEKYIAFCTNETNMKIFSQPFWLDAVCGNENWDVALVEADGHIIASLPYYIKKRTFLTFISMPQLTQTMGPYIKYPSSQKYEKKITFEKEIMDKLFDQLPSFDAFSQSFHYDITNWLPLYWRGYRQTTKYTYVIEDLSNMDSVVAAFSEAKRRILKRDTHTPKIVHDLGLEKFFALNKAIFNSQGLEVYYPFEFVKNIDDACKTHNCRKLFFAIDEHHNILAAAYVIWDHISLYVIMGGSNPKFKNKNAGTILDYEMMKFASARNLKFDFEGSMLEGVEGYNRSFGAVQKPYLQISKTNSYIVKIKRCMTGLFS